MAAMEWFRLWHDMPNDPKWRTVARLSDQPIALVISVALHLMVDASRNVTRGHVTVTAEDIASALDVTEPDIEAIFTAMQGRILHGDSLTGWEKRQPKREDAGNPETGAKSATERKRDERERKKAALQSTTVTQSHDPSRNVTLDKDKDKDKENKDIGAAAQKSDSEDKEPEAEGGKKKLGVRELVASGVDRQHAQDWLSNRKTKRLPLTQTALDGVKREADKAGMTLPEAIARAAAEGWAGFKASWLAVPGATSGGTGEWWSSASTIIAEGKRFGIEQEPDEPMPTLRARIQAAKDVKAKDDKVPPKEPPRSRTEANTSGEQQGPPAGALKNLMKMTGSRRGKSS